MLFNDFLYVGRLNTAIECTVGIYNNNRAECAKTEATGLNELNFVFKTEGSDVFLKCFLDFATARGGTACTATNKNLCTNQYLLPPYASAGVNSTTTSPCLRCFSTTVFAFSAVIFT